MAVVRENGGLVPPELNRSIEDIAKRGGTPLVVAEGSRPLGVIYLKDVVKGGLMVNIGVEAFLPASQIDIIPPRDLQQFVGAVHVHRDARSKVRQEFNM